MEVPETGAAPIARTHDEAGWQNFVKEYPMIERQHPTTRRGFIIAMGFGGVSLYGLWAGYGAAPWPQALLGLGRAESSGAIDTAPPADAMAGMDHASSGTGTTGEEFRRSLDAFIERYQMPDGSVYPRRLAADVVALVEPPTGSGTMTDMAEMPGMDHDQAMAGMPAEHLPDTTAPIEVYLLAERWFYEPSQLRLDAGVRYHFKMMAADVSHGASIQFGQGSRMIRLRPNIATELEVVFDRPGSHLIYCTLYCGPAHDLMQARIDVV